MARQVLLAISCLFTAIFLAVVNPSLAYPQTFYVDGNAGRDSLDATGSELDPFKTINYVFSRFNLIDTIYVKYSTYHESVSLTPYPRRSMKLIGIASGGARPVIRSEGPNSHTIGLNNFKGKIEGLEITGATNASGINCNTSDGTSTGQIVDCKIHGNSVGIHLTNGTIDDECSPHVYKNFIYANTVRGIGVMKYSSPMIEGNYIYQNGSGVSSEG